LVNGNVGRPMAPSPKPRGQGALSSADDCRELTLRWSLGAVVFQIGISAADLRRPPERCVVLSGTGRAHSVRGCALPLVIDSGSANMAAAREPDRRSNVGRRARVFAHPPHVRVRKTVNGDQRRKPPFASKFRVLLPSQNLRCLLVAPAVGVNSSLLDGPADPSDRVNRTYH
jgi:hypothetical protein